MVPILYDAGETAFESNGLGRLIDCTSCIVTEARNGEYELELTYPLTGRKFEEITLGRIVACTHDDKGDVQPFVVYQRSAPLGGVVTFNARHISYELATVVVDAFTAYSALEALPAIKTNSINANRFDFSTDLTTVATMTNDRPAAARSLLGGTEGSILDTYGGEYEFDKFDVILHAHRGTSSGVVIRYGKNLTDLKQVLDGSGVYNAVVPFWAHEEEGTRTVVTLPERIVSAEGVTDPIAIPLDLSQEFEEQPTEEQLRTAAQQHLAQREPWVPDENISLDFINLSQTDEYAGMYNLQRLSLCDRVDVVYTALGVVAKDIEIIKVEYDVLREMYTKMELGKARSTFAEVITEKTEEQISQVETNLQGFFDSAISAATDAITGVNGGHVVISRDANGKPQEILILDTESINTATNILRINLNGIGFSQDGGRTYGTAWTLDGQFVADYITAGTLKSIRIEGPNTATFWDLASGIFQNSGTTQVTAQVETAEGTYTPTTYDVTHRTVVQDGRLDIYGKLPNQNEAKYLEIGISAEGMNYEFYETIAGTSRSASYPYAGIKLLGDKVTGLAGGELEYDGSQATYYPQGAYSPDYIELGGYKDLSRSGSYPDRNQLRLGAGWGTYEDAIVFTQHYTWAETPSGVRRQFREGIKRRTAWEFALDDQLFIDSTKINRIVCIGYLTDNRTSMWVQIPLCRPIAPEVTFLDIYAEMKARVSTSGGYVVGGSGSTSSLSYEDGDLTYEAFWSDAGVTLKIRKPNGGAIASGQNNYPLAVDFIDLGINFFDSNPYA